MQSAHKIVHKIRLESQREDLEGLQRQTYVPPIGNRSPGYFVTYTLYAPVWLIIQLAPFSDRHGCVFVRLEPHREDLEGLQRQTAMVLWSISVCPEPVVVHDRSHLILKITFGKGRRAAFTPAAATATAFYRSHRSAPAIVISHFLSYPMQRNATICQDRLGTNERRRGKHSQSMSLAR
jgi:hypothetical protein